MTAHDPALQWPEHSPPAHFAAARALVRPLATLTAITVTAAVCVYESFGPVPPIRFASLASALPEVEDLRRLLFLPVVVGGPAPRPLPALPLRPGRDALTVGARFTSRIGGSTGRMD
jgi:hypothetical protein